MNNRLTFLKQERVRRSVSKVLQAAMLRELKRVTLELSGSPTYTLSILAQHQLRVRDILKEFYNRAFTRAANEFSGAVRKAASRFGPGNNQSAKDAARELADQWAEKRALDISSYTQKKVARIIESGVSEGLSSDAIGRSIKKLMGNSISSSRALAIARTESHAALQSGSLATAKESGVIGKKMWVSTNDGRERDSHREADGQIVGVDEPFTVGGVSLDFPGDPDGPAEEVINCRCVVQYILAED